MIADTTVDLDVLHAAIIADIKAQYPDLKTVEFYRDDQGERDEDRRKTLPVPACILELTEMPISDDNDANTGQLTVRACFEAHLILSGINNPGAKQSVRKLAGAFAAWLRLRRWNNPDAPLKKLPTGPALVMGAFKDDFSPELDRYEVWRVEWEQNIDLGNYDWDDSGETPRDPRYSWSPKIGNGHEDDYTSIDPDQGHKGSVANDFNVNIFGNDA